MGDEMNRSRKTNFNQNEAVRISYGIVNSGLWVLTLLVSGLFLYNIFNYNILAFRYLNILVTPC